MTRIDSTGLGEPGCGQVGNWSQSRNKVHTLGPLLAHMRVTNYPPTRILLIMTLKLRKGLSIDPINCFKESDASLNLDVTIRKSLRILTLSLNCRAPLAPVSMILVKGHFEGHSEVRSKFLLTQETTV
jgi:hypothetical protein